MSKLFMVSTLLTNTHHHVRTVAMGVGDFIPISPDWGPLEPFSGVYKVLAGVGMALMVLGGFGAIVLGGLRMLGGGKNRASVEGGADQAKVGLIVFVLGFILGVVLLAIAGVATLIK